MEKEGKEILELLWQITEDYEGGKEENGELYRLAVWIIKMDGLTEEGIFR